MPNLKSHSYAVVVLIVYLLACPGRAGSGESRTRTFDLEYAVQLPGLKPGGRVRVWLPVPPANQDQRVQIRSLDVPGEHRLETEPRHGNRILYLEHAAPESGELSCKVTYRIRRSEAGVTPGQLPEAERELYLSANRLVPVGGKPAELLSSVESTDDPVELGRRLYLRVLEHLSYDKTQPGYGRGDAVWACDSRTGNCTDFHSLFMALARTSGLPARFEIGFPLPAERGSGVIGGYHCWAAFYAPGQGWVPVDISEADKHPEMTDYYFGHLTEDRATFSVGRDIELVPQQDGPALNYFVYPYVEVDGEVWPPEKIRLHFEYADLPAGAEP